jgi:hypothetical protein
MEVNKALQKYLESDNPDIQVIGSVLLKADSITTEEKLHWIEYFQKKMSDTDPLWWQEHSQSIKNIIDLNVSIQEGKKDRNRKS